MARRAVVERPRLHSPSHLGVRVSRTYRDGAGRRGVRREVRREVREADSNVGGIVGVAWIRA
jgi:ribonuclease P protein component